MSHQCQGKILVSRYSIFSTQSQSILHTPKSPDISKIHQLHIYPAITPPLASQSQVIPALEEHEWLDTPSSNRLQTRAVDDLHVNAELAAAVVENKDANAATAGVEGSLEAVPEVGLVHDGEVLLDIASLGHGDDCSLALAHSHGITEFTS